MACIYRGLALSTSQGTPENKEAHSYRVSHSLLSGASQVSLQKVQEVAFVLGPSPAPSWLPGSLPTAEHPGGKAHTCPHPSWRLSFGGKKREALGRAASEITGAAIR